MADRTAMLFEAKDRAGEFYRKIFCGLFEYISNRIPEISDDIYQIDDALKAGFGWELGPFETWDAIGVKKGISIMKQYGKKPAPWVFDMLESGQETFFKIEDNTKKYYDIKSKTIQAIPGTENLLYLDNLRQDKLVWKNGDTSIFNLGDGILGLEFHSKMNTIGGGIIQGLHKAIDLAEKDYEGLVVYNDGQNFSAGANVGMIFMMAIEQEYDELDMAIRQFQNVMMRVRYSEIPVVVAPHNMALGGACEMSMHSDKVVAHSELYMGLVEFGVGLIPGGGGTKEFAKRLSEELHAGDIKVNQFRNRFLTIGQAQVSTSAEEAFDMGYLRRGIDEVVVSREHQLTYAKAACIKLASNGYTPPIKEKNTIVLGQEALGLVYVGAHSMHSGNYISEHDKLISEKLGFVLAGGDLSENTHVSEQYLLDLERKAFLELCTKRKTLERLESILKYGKILRN